MMLICPNCNNQQEDGKFCGVCGTAVQPAANTEQPVEGAEQEELKIGAQNQRKQQSADVPPVQNQVNEQGTVNQGAATMAAQANPTSETIKNGLQHYWTYYLNLLKSPQKAFQTNENNFVNGLVTLGLYAVIFSLSLYFLVNSLASTFGGGFVSIPFFGVVSRLVLFIIILFVITFGSALAMMKLAKDQSSFKTIIAQYGSIIVPFTVLNLIAMLGGIIGSIQLTLFSIVLSLIFTFTFIPVLFVYEKVSRVSKNSQKVYFSLATVLMIGLISYFIGEAFILNMVEELDNMMRYGLW